MDIERCTDVKGGHWMFNIEDVWCRMDSIKISRRMLICRVRCRLFVKCWIRGRRRRDEVLVSLSLSRRGSQGQARNSTRMRREFEGATSYYMSWLPLWSADISPSHFAQLTLLTVGKYEVGKPSHHSQQVFQHQLRRSYVRRLAVTS